jgi:superfamily I DNA/RNA helicase
MRRQRPEKNRCRLGAIHRDDGAVGNRTHSRQTGTDDSPRDRSRLQGTFAGGIRELPPAPRRFGTARHVRAAVQTLEEFLTQLALLTNVEAEDNEQTKDTEQIRLSTIHQAKGLEFDVVFVIMLCEGLFPSARSMESVEGEEEERRLFYVAVTRARNELYLSYPLIRMMPGTGGDVMQQPSRFLGEIPKELVEECQLRSFNPYG